MAGTVYEPGLRIALPLGLRDARGRLDAAEAALREAEQQLRLREDVLTTSIRDVASAWSAAWERFETARSLANTTERLAAPERRRFEAGAVTLLVVNLREQAAAEATIATVEAVCDLWIAAASWEALTGCDPASELETDELAQFEQPIEPVASSQVQAPQAPRARHEPSQHW